MRFAVDADALPAVLLDPDARAGDVAELAGEVPAEAQREVLDLADRLLLGEGVDGVLLRVGGHHVGVVAGEVGAFEVSPQRGGHGEVAEFVHRTRAPHGDHPDFGFPVLVRPQRDPHGQLPR